MPLSTEFLMMHEQDIGIFAAFVCYLVLQPIYQKTTSLIGGGAKHVIFQLVQEVHTATILRSSLLTTENRQYHSVVQYKSISRLQN